MPDQDLYGDAAPDPQAPEQKPETNPKDTAGDSQTAEVPLAVFGDHPKVGDKCEFEVTQVNEDSAIIKYASEEQEEEPTAPEPPQATAPGSMQSMME
jgi:hypothetical protein